MTVGNYKEVRKMKFFRGKNFFCKNFSFPWKHFEKETIMSKLVL